MDHLPFGMFADADAYDAREEMAGERGDDTSYEEEEQDNDGDYIPGLDDGEWIEDGDDRGVDADDRSCEYGDW